MFPRPISTRNKILCLYTLLNQRPPVLNYLCKSETNSSVKIVSYNFEFNSIILVVSQSVIAFYIFSHTSWHEGMSSSKAVTFIANHISLRVISYCLSSPGCHRHQQIAVSRLLPLPCMEQTLTKPVLRNCLKQSTLKLFR